LVSLGNSKHKGRSRPQGNRIQRQASGHTRIRHKDTFRISCVRPTIVIHSPRRKDNHKDKVLQQLLYMVVAGYEIRGELA